MMEIGIQIYFMFEYIYMYIQGSTLTIVQVNFTVGQPEHLSMVVRLSS